MRQEELINRFDHVVVYIWGTTGGGGRGVGHIAVNLHLANINNDAFVSLWPGNKEGDSLTWQYKFNEVYNAEHDHGPTSVLVFYTLDVLAMIARFNTLKMQTEAWVMMPTKQQSLASDSPFHNCCTAVWSLLKEGGIYGPKGIFTEKEFHSVVSTAKMKLPIEGSRQIPRAAGQFSKASSKSQDTHHTSMAASGPSTLTWEALLSGERYGPDMLFEILTKAKDKEKEKIKKANPRDARLTVQFTGHRNVLRADGMFDEGVHGAETGNHAVAKAGYK